MSQHAGSWKEAHIRTFRSTKNNEKRSRMFKDELRDKVQHKGAKCLVCMISSCLRRRFRVAESCPQSRLSNNTEWISESLCISMHIVYTTLKARLLLSARSVSAASSRAKIPTTLKHRLQRSPNSHIAQIHCSASSARPCLVWELSHDSHVFS